MEYMCLDYDCYVYYISRGLSSRVSCGDVCQIGRQIFHGGYKVETKTKDPRLSSAAKDKSEGVRTRTLSTQDIVRGMYERGRVVEEDSV